jgi:hypothetical protein
VTQRNHHRTTARIAIAAIRQTHTVLRSAAGPFKPELRIVRYMLPKKPRSASGIAPDFRLDSNAHHIRSQFGQKVLRQD